ncbi:LPS export ABC transporter permease LptG [candidate division TA06 bacterium]|nr:LPS export ABC transporter permease LptG [candidate division TA06 bacterium]
MRILDRYLLQEFLKVLLYSLFAFIFIYITVDLFEDIARFIDKKVGLFTIFRLYLYQIPFITVLIVPVAALLSCFFTVGVLARRNELSAILTSGVSLNRTLFPLFLFGLLLSLLIFFLEDVIVPYGNQKKRRIERVEIDKRPPTNPYYKRDFNYLGAEGRVIRAQLFDGGKKELVKVTFFEFRDESSLRKRIDAEKAVWTEEGWIFQKGVMRTFDEAGEEDLLSFEELPQPQLEETPEDFSREEKEPEEMSFRELKRYISKKRRGGEEVGKERVDLHTKFSFPLANLIVILFGAPLAARIRKGGIAFGFVLSLTICFFYWGLLQTARSLGHSGYVPPALAAWFPNLLFGGCGIFLLWWARR